MKSLDVMTLMGQDTGLAATVFHVLNFGCPHVEGSLCHEICIDLKAKHRRPRDHNGNPSPHFQSSSI